MEHRGMEQVPGHDDEFNVEEGAAAPLGEARPPQQGRLRAGLVAAVAVLLLASLVLASQVSPWQRAAATHADRPQRQGQKQTRRFHSLLENNNANTEDLGTLCTAEIKEGDTELSVQNTDVFQVGSHIVIIDTDDSSAENEEATVKSVGDGKITLEQPVSKTLPSFSFIVVPAKPDSYGTSGGGYSFSTPAPPTPAPPTPAPPTPAPAPPATPAAAATADDGGADAGAGPRGRRRK
ncbi:unnamed protein product [Prorocentrum cordatum]|uniref:Uncharacterized protein n=1 Tax=Prorocentrum cordatum TaxID=2364126 RepID=A0ABN9Y453_9DINO|nr:unnamed protein product [Polarella glacialis]